jgi:hypothetical protein
MFSEMYVAPLLQSQVYFSRFSAVSRQIETAVPVNNVKLWNLCPVRWRAAKADLSGGGPRFLQARNSKRLQQV